MGNNQSVNLERVRRRSTAIAIVPRLSEEDMELLVTRTNMTRDEVKEYYNKFCTATHGSNIITRQIFSEIMLKCFPRTYKVYQKCRLYLSLNLKNICLGRTGSRYFQFI